MTISPSDVCTTLATSVRFEAGSLAVMLDDGRCLFVPLDWYPRLLHATENQRANWRLIGNGEGIHWPDIEEDISVASLIAGRPSAESARSLARWLGSRPR